MDSHEFTEYLSMNINNVTAKTEATLMFNQDWLFPADSDILP
jgi:hypothetical protein